MGELAQVTYETSGAGVGAIVLFSVVGYAIIVIPYWVVFTKAGQPGWAALIPIYNYYIVLSKSFGHGVGFTLGLIFLNIIFYYILAFGSSTYRGPAAGAAVMASPPPPPPMPTG